MKKILSLILTLFIMCALIGCSRSTEKVDSNSKTNSKINTYEEYHYVIVNDEYVLLSIYLGNEKIPTIPEKIDGKPVKIIGSSCFASKEIESITIPDTVTEIWEMAFLNCKKLSDITLSKNTEKIGNKAFEGCILLQNIELPKTLKTIDAYAFFNCTSLNKLTIPKNIGVIGAYAFTDSGITELKFTGDAPAEFANIFLNNTDTVILHPADAHGWDNEKFKSYTLKKY